MIRKWLLPLLVFLALSGPLRAQTEAEPTITLPATTVTLSQVFEQLRKAGYTLSYGNNIDLDQKVSYSQRSMKLKALLKETGKATGLGFRQKDQKLIVYRKPTAQVDPDAPKVTLSGYIRDAANGEELIGATVYLNELAIGTTSNIYGFYSITVPAGSYTVSYRFIGYQTQEKPMDLTTATTFNIELPGSKTALKEVEITAEKDNEALTEVQMSMERLDIKTVEEIPQFLGETDIIRSVLMLPGVATVGEGTSGFNVRGGAVDQNLILLDEASVYNSSHVFGFFSVFNSDAIKGLELYKGGIPARYGGRLSSVMDVRQKEGNSKGFSGRGGISVLSSRLTVEGPLKKGKSSFMVSGRRSYGDLFLKLSSTLSDNTAYFYDLNLKVNHKFDDKNRLFLSGYFGRDVWKFGEDFASDWGNSTATVRWNHLFNDRLFSNFTYVFSNFTYSLGVPTGTDAFDWDSKIVNHNLKADFSYFPSPRHTIEFGLNTMFYRFTPGDVRGLGEGSIFNDISIAREHALRPALYASDEFRVNDRLTLQAGLRLSLFMNMGKTEVNQYEEGVPIDRSTFTGTRAYDWGEVVRTYSGVEPRFAANYQLNDVSSAKLSYNRTRQFIHLISNTTSPTPIDVWRPSGEYIEPATADQIALGYFRNFSDNQFEASAEVYYKHFQGLVDYKAGAELILNERLETELLSGSGDAYGVELQIKKRKGLLTGWISYTLARSERDIPGINNDEPYPSNYDRLHDLSVVAIYPISEKLKLGANFAFTSGRAITYPDSRYVVQGIQVPNYNNRNGERAPSYHRLDLSLTYTPKPNSNKRWKGEWVFSVYNVYNRRNPFSVYFRQDADNPTRTEAVRLSVFGSIVPAVTYNFQF